MSFSNGLRRQEKTEANVFRAMRMHHVVKRDRFSFAISGGIKFNFSGRSLISFFHESE